MKNLDSINSIKRQSWAARRKAINPQPVSLSQESLVELSYLEGGRILPLVIQPRVEGVSLTDWISNEIAFVQTSLHKCGGILFRGFDLRAAADFNNVINSLPIKLMHYMEGATPRVEMQEKIYTSTEFPPDQAIALHNELCYVTTWPMKIFFFCVKAAETGGETPIGDVRKVLQRLDPKTLERFVEKGWMLVRNFGDHMGLAWQTSYRVSRKAEAEDYFRKARIEYEWKGGDRLRTRQVRPCVATHPVTGEQVWFNHIAFWHVSSMEKTLREMLLEEYGEQELPFATYYGDGTKIEDSVIEEVREAYRQETVAFPWREGDFLMLDNMLTAHGRFPFTGQRSILAAMGEPFSRTDIQ
jgi:alpha-ketoglutarate-dependent taurine dioxygenase